MDVLFYDLDEEHVADQHYQPRGSISKVSREDGISPSFGG
jgi:hypothetical protein